MDRLDRRGRLVGDWELGLADGTRLSLPRQSLMACAVAFRGSYDAASRELLLAHVTPGTLVLDIGASLGLWTVGLGRAAEAIGAHVWAFEPHPNNHSWLHRNIELNRLGPFVTVHETALGDATGEVVMDGGEAGRRGGNSFIAVGSPQPHGVSVPVVTLDSVPRPARVSAIKIDVEGYEVRILRGAQQLIEHDRPTIFGEFNAVWLDARGDDLLGFLDDLRDTGYEIFAVEGRRSRPWLAANMTRLRSLPPGRVAEDLLLRPVV
jgi:FkbM family methyltransferase